jgi:hypothetical protein
MDCEAPCKTCDGAENICLTCDGSKGRVYLLNSTCYDECPLQYANNDDTVPKSCIGCESGCDRCNATNIEECLICGPDLFLYKEKPGLGVCQGSCPDGMKGVDRVCIIDDDDLKVLYFPFLIAALIFTIVVFFGKMKTKAILVGGESK